MVNGLFLLIVIAVKSFVFEKLVIPRERLKQLLLFNIK